MTAAPAVDSAAGSLYASAPAWSDGAPEEWILGERVIEGEDVDVSVRYRVLPGGHLVVRDSTLTFTAAAGLTGIVAEPGGAVTVEASSLRTDAPGAFLLHFEGPLTLSDVAVDGAAYWVVQPRPATDHIDAATGALLEGQVPGWSLARVATAPDVQIIGVRADAPLTVGAPVGYTTSTQTLHPVSLGAVEVTVPAGPAVECYETSFDPDPDAGLPVLGPAAASRIEFSGGVLDADAGTVLSCPTGPIGKALPDRNPPLVPPSPLVDLVAEPPRPAVRAGPDELRLDATALRGAGIGLAVSFPMDVDATGMNLDGLATGVLITADAHVAVTDATGLALGTGFDVRGGTLTATDGVLQGTEIGAGVAAHAGTVTLDGIALEGFRTGVLAVVPVQASGVDLVGGDVCLHALSGVVLSGATLDGCATGILLDATSGATITGNTFTENLDPLRVFSPGPSLAHFEHAVSANTVDGRALAYLVDAVAPPLVTEPVGHLVVAYSTDVRMSDVALPSGQAHVVASDGVVLGAVAAQAAGLLAHFDDAADDAWQRIHDDVRFAPYLGSILGPEGPLDAGYANDLDAARALAALWRAEGRTVRFVDGTHTGDTEDFLDWVGMEHPGYAFGMQGIQAQWFGATYVLQRTWLELQVAPGVWVEADPIYNQYAWSEPLDVDSATAWDADEVVAAAMENASLDYTYHGASGLDLDALLGVQEQYNATAMPSIAPEGATRGSDLFRVPTSHAFGPDEDVARTPEARFAEVPADRLWTTHITTRDLFAPLGPGAHIAFEGDLAELYGHRMTLEAFPDTPAMHAALTAAGGLYGIDRTSMTFTTFLKVDGEIQDFIGGVNSIAPDGATVRSLPGDPADRPVTYHAGDLVGLDIEVRRPGGALHAVHSSPFRVGGTYAVVFDLGGSPEPLLDRRIDAYNATLQSWGHDESEVLIDHGDLLGELYHIQGMDYFRRLHDVGGLVAAQNDVLEVPLASVAVTGTSVLPVIDGGVPKVTPTPPYFDIRGIDHAYPIAGDLDALLQHHFVAGVFSSALEDKTFTHMYDLPAVSTIKALAVAADEGVPIYHLNATTPEALDVLALPAPVMDSVVAAVNRGWEVIVPGSEISYYNWTGVGWIEIDLATGSAGWLIYGGTAPVTGALDIEAWPILRGGAGAQYVPGSDGRMFDWGYEDDVLQAIDWTDKGVGVVSGSAETAFRYATINNAGNWARLRLDGVALNNHHRALAGDWDLPGRYGKFAGRAGNAVAVVGHAADMWDIANSDATMDSKIGQMAGVTAINVATVAGGAAVIKGSATAGAFVGGLVFDGPGLVGGAIIGGVIGAVGLGFANHYAKKGWRGLFD